jgi:hypothetical protein
MSGVKDVIAVCFAVLLFLFLIYMAFYLFINPYKENSQFMELDESLAMYLDTFSQIDSGRVVIPMEDEVIRRVSSIEVKYQQKGRQAGYRTPQDGWYVIVKYSLAGRESIGTARINSYGNSLGSEATLFRPENVCIRKEEAREWAVIEKC